MHLERAYCVWSILWLYMACTCNLSSLVGWCGNIDTVLKRQSQLQQTPKLATSFLIFEKNYKVWYFLRIVCQLTILIKYHTLLSIFEKAAQFEIVVCCKLLVALYDRFQASSRVSLKRLILIIRINVRFAFNML